MRVASLCSFCSVFSVVGVVGVVGVVVGGCDPATGVSEGDGDEGEGDEGEGDEGEGDAGEGDVVESEPNGGDPIADVDDASIGAGIRGVIDGAADVDFFHVEDAVKGHVYAVRADADFSVRLAVLDDGRGGDAPGGDYVRLGHDDVTFAVLGGGVYVAVDDDNGDGGAYRVSFDDVTADVSAGALASGTVSGDLGSAAGVVSYSVDVDAGSDVVFDANASGDGDLRLFVVSLSTGDWIARNDDRAADDANPRIDAPLFDEGPYVLLVENIDEAATDLGYTLTAVVP